MALDRAKSMSLLGCGELIHHKVKPEAHLNKSSSHNKELLRIQLNLKKIQRAETVSENLSL